MANKITKKVSLPDEAMIANKAVKKMKVKDMGSRDRVKEGGSWPHQGFGTEPDYSHYIKSGEKSDFFHEEPGHGEQTPGDWPNPVKKPSLRDISAKEHLGDFASDESVKKGFKV